MRARSGRLGVVVIALLTSALLGAAAVPSAGPLGLPGARAIKVCAAAGPYWPTMTLALHVPPPSGAQRSDNFPTVW